MAKLLQSDLPLRRQPDFMADESRFGSGTPSSSASEECGISVNIDGWTKHRALIEKLYIDCQWKLDEVRRFMETEHGHVGSTKQYKTHFKTWNIRKNVKKEEALFVMSKKTTRDAIGRKSEFRLRGKPVSLDNVLRYLQRKGIPDPRIAASIERVRTPPSFSVRTPSPSPPPSPPRSSSSTSYDQSSYDQSTPLDPNTPMSADTAMPDFFTDGAEMEEIKRFLSTIDDSVWSSMDLSKEAEILAMVTAPLPSLSNPTKYQTPEHLFFNINLYLLGTFESNLFVHTHNGKLYRSRHPPPGIYKFQDQWGTGLNMIRNNLHTQGRRIFAQVCDSAVQMFHTDVSLIFNHQDPYWMRCLIHLYRTTVSSQPKLGKVLLGHMAQQAAKLLPVGHPWREIFTSIANIDEDILDVLMRSWDLYNQLTSERLSRLDEEYIYSLFGYAWWTKTSIEREAEIFDLWQEAVATIPLTDRRTLYLGYHYAGAKAENGEPEVALGLFQQQLDILEGTGLDEQRFLCIERMAMCYREIGELGEAEGYMRQAAALARERQWEEQISEAETILRKWLTEWGRQEEADVLGRNARAMGFLIPLDNEESE